jgi:hypothetical protein
MTKIHEIDGKKYVEVERKANVGDKIIVVKEESSCGHYRDGDVLTVSDANRWPTADSGSGISVKEFAMALYHSEYRVLEPVEEEAHPDVTDLIANLAQRLSASERRVASLENQLADTQRNIERLGYEQANSTKDLDDKIEMAIGDIVMLDERTQPRHADVVTFDKFLDSVADKVAAKLVGGVRQ